MTTLVLRRIIWSDGQPSRDPEDFNVIDDEVAVGRIYRTTDPRGEGLCVVHLRIMARVCADGR